MPLYRYTAKDISSNTIKGLLDAADEAALGTALRQTQVFLIRCKQVQDEDSQTYKLKAMELSEFSRQVGTMLSAGITLVRAVHIMLGSDMKPRVRKIFYAVHKQLQQGRTLSDAMESQGQAFPELMVNMFRAGEASGQLDKTAAKMAVHYEKEHRLNNKVKNASLYPLILLVVSVLVIIIIFTLVLPQFFTLFEGITLPLSTIIVMAISDFLIDYWYVALLSTLGAIALSGILLRIPSIRIKFDHSKLKIPLIGKLLKVIYTARFSRTLASLYSSGLSMINALTISSKTMGNAYIASLFPEAVKKVRNGDMLSKAVAGIDGFDSKLAPSIYVGEETGKLDDMLESVADNYDYESEIAVQKMIAITEPTLIVLMAVVIGTVMLSVMLPIWKLYNNVG